LFYFVDTLVFTLLLFYLVSEEKIQEISRILNEKIKQSMNSTTTIPMKSSLSPKYDLNFKKNY